LRLSKPNPSDRRYPNGRDEPSASPQIEDITVRNLSPATQRSYIQAVAKFSRFFGRSPDRLGLEDLRAFQVHLVSNGISWPALNQTVCALRFFCGVTVGHGEIPERIPYARAPRKLPAADRRTTTKTGLSVGIGAVGCIITTGGVRLNDEEKAPIGLSKMEPRAQHAGSVPEAVFRLPGTPAKW
jgi:hypothetical protein